MENEKENESKNLQLMASEPIPKAILTLAIPTVFSMIISLVYNLTDTYFIGLLDDPVQLGAISLAFPVFLVFQALGNMFGAGAPSYISRCLGAGKYDEVRRTKAGYDHGKILYAILDGNAAYCMNFGLAADGGQLMNSYPNSSTSMTAQQEKLLSYCLYFGFNSNSATPPSNDQCDQFIATQAMVWVIVGNLFGTGSGDSAARKLGGVFQNRTLRRRLCIF